MESNEEEDTILPEEKDSILPEEKIPILPEEKVPILTEENINVNSQSGNINVNSQSGDFQDGNTRLGFIRRIYGMLLLQLLCLIGMICAFLYVLEAHTWVVDNYWIWYLALILWLAMLIAFSCFNETRREYPLNWICLTAYTAAQGFLLGTASTNFSTSEILMSTSVSAVTVLAEICFAMQNRVDFTMKNGCVFGFAIISICFVFICAIVRSHYLYIFYANFAAFCFILYCVFDTQLMLAGRHDYSLSPDEHTFACLNLYCDIVHILKIIGAIVGDRVRP